MEKFQNDPEKNFPVMILSVKATPWLTENGGEIATSSDEPPPFGRFKVERGRPSWMGSVCVQDTVEHRFLHYQAVYHHIKYDHILI